MKQYLLAALLFPLAAGTSGCIGSWIANGKTIELNQYTTPHTLRHEFGEPVEVEIFSPPVSLSEAGFLWTDVSSDPAKGKSIIDKNHTVVSVMKYRYSGAVRNPHYIENYAFESGIALWTLGLSELYFIPWGIQERIKKSNDVTELMVAFSADEDFLAERISIIRE
ncbi:MAG: hypothetical protein AAF333_02610 [Planctomycetota bacterium]